MLFRRAVPADVPQILRVVNVMLEGTAFAPPTATKIETFVRSNHYNEGAWKDGELVGFMCGSLSETFLNNEVNAYDKGLFVLPEHRGGTLAVRLIRNFEDWARGLGARNVWITQCVGHEIDKTRHFFERLGYECQGFATRKKL